MLNSGIHKKKNLKRQYKSENFHETENNITNDLHELGGYEQTVYSLNNHIYFYNDINTTSILELVKNINYLNKKIKNETSNYNITYDTECDSNVYIYLHINSFGGYVFDALAGVDTIINSEIPIISIIEGCAASAATFLSIVCYKRYMRPHSSMLIHQLSGGYWGTYEQMCDDMKNSKYLMKIIKDIYIEYSNQLLTSDKLDKYLKRDIWWSPKKCKKLGLIDEIF